MKLLNFIHQESSIAKNRITTMAIVSGLSNALLIALINHATESGFAHGVQGRLFLIYLAAFCLFIYTQKFVLTESMLAIEEALRSVRIRIAGKLCCTELAFIEQSNRNDFYIRLTQDSNLISQSIMSLISAGQSAILITTCLLYILWISPLSFLMAIGFLGVTYSIYISHKKKTRQQLQQAQAKETVFFDTLEHLIDGFKEIKLNRAKKEDLLADIERTSLDSEAIKVAVSSAEVTDWMMARMSFYTLLPLLVFIVPALQGEQSDQIYKITAAILFIMGPINVLIGSIPTLTRVNMAIDSFQSLEQDITSATRKTDGTDLPAWHQFSYLDFKGISYTYYDKQKKSLFSCGPNDLMLQKGELIFIVGGNGSGKSTLLKLITGLYCAQKGTIYRDGDLVDDETYPCFRELFSTVFTDFHLFNRLYGLKKVEINQVDEWLKKMDLYDKTRYSAEGYFTKTDLSTGQKKRLVFIATILEDKPVMVFDELAADQDPTFKRYFYEEILPNLAKSGKTVIVVTHDEAYFHCANRVFRMENGLLEPLLII